MSLADLGALSGRIRAEVGKAIVGQEEVLDHLLVALFAGGHVLLEGPPGTAPRPSSRRLSPPLSASISGASSSRRT